MTEEQDKMVLENIPLIYKAIKDMHCYWKTDDEFQNYYDDGLIGLINGVKTYSDKQYKLSTYLMRCIRNEILKGIYMSFQGPRKIHRIPMARLDEPISPMGETLLMDLVKDDSVDIENEIYKKIMFEHIFKKACKVSNKKNLYIIKKYFYSEDKDSISLQKIADEIGITREAVRSRIKTIVKRIKEELQKEERE